MLLIYLEMRRRLSIHGLPHAHAEELSFATSAPNTVYVTLRTTARQGETWNGGIYRSDDAGRSWRAANGEDLARRLGRRADSSYMTSNYKEIVVDPHSPEVVYVGNQDWVSAGVRKTTNGGRNWQPLTRHTGKGRNMDYGWLEQWGPAIECMAISPAAPNRLAIGTSGHVFVTSEGGQSWQQRYCRQWQDGRFAGNGLEVTCLWSVVPDPARSQRLYCCFYDLGLLISEDRGESFRRSYKGMKHANNCFNVLVDPKAPSTLWAGTGERGNNVGDVCRSDDAGASWQVVGSPQSGLPVSQTKHLALDLQSPVGQRRLFVTVRGSGLYESRDGGFHWHCLNGNLPAIAAKDPRGLICGSVSSNHMVLTLGGTPENGAGIYETHDGGHNWQRLNQEPAAK